MQSNFRKSHPYWPEGFGCFAIWEGAQAQRDLILSDISDRFKVLGVFEIYWSDLHYDANYERLYERPISGKVFSQYNKKIGKPPFTFIIVRDPHPDLKYLVSVSGHVEQSNKNIVNAKYRYRDLFEHPYLVHASSNYNEFLFQASMLLGLERMTNVMARDTPMEEVLHKDLEGAEGWRD